jgi:hypothetical protein
MAPRSPGIYFWSSEVFGGFLGVFGIMHQFCHDVTGCLPVPSAPAASVKFHLDAAIRSSWKAWSWQAPTIRLDRCVSTSAPALLETSRRRDWLERPAAKGPLGSSCQTAVMPAGLPASHYTVNCWLGRKAHPPHQATLACPKCPCAVSNFGAGSPFLSLIFTPQIIQ